MKTSLIRLSGLWATRSKPHADKLTETANFSLGLPPQKKASSEIITSLFSKLGRAIKSWNVSNKAPEPVVCRNQEWLR